MTQRLEDSKSLLEEYITSIKNEKNPSDAYLKTTWKVLSRINLSSATNETIIKFLNELKKPEQEDPLHKWIGTYNLYLFILKRFFNWYGIPDITNGLKHLKRKETSIYKPSDLWTQEDDLLFLKYCASKKYRCYHAISRDSSCRPSELLRVRIKDVVFKLVGDKQYAEILVNGKTGSRHIPLINSIPYLKDWMDDHPQKSNPNSFLFSNHGKSITSTGIRNNYKYRIRPYFTSLKNIDSEDKKRITELLKKPWNPYIFRHSALTDKSKILKEHVLRQHAGWSGRSQMHLKYLHYYGNESSEAILEAYGLKPNEQQENKMKPKDCPNCREPNTVESKFCAKCRMVLSYDAYTETVEEKDSEVSELKTQMNDMRQTMDKILSLVQENPKLAKVKTEVLSGI